MLYRSINMHGPAPSALFSTDFPVLFTVALIFSTIILAYIWTFSKNKLNSDSDKRVESPARVPNNSLFTITPFFHQRFNFLNWGFKKTGEPIFQFSLLQVSSSALGSAVPDAFYYFRIKSSSYPEKLQERRSFLQKDST